MRSVGAQVMSEQLFTITQVGADDPLAHVAVYPQLGEDEESVAIIDVLPAVAYFIVYVCVSGVEIVDVSGQVERVIVNVFVYEVLRLSLNSTFTGTSYDPAESVISVELQDTTQPFRSAITVGKESPFEHVALYPQLVVSVAVIVWLESAALIV